MDLFEQLGDSLNPANAHFLKDVGIKRAVEHADKKIDSWSEKAYKHFLDYCKNNDEFQTEDVRVHCEHIGFEIPPSKRAWGAIVLRASKAGIVVKRGVFQTSNPKCHMAYANVWGVVRDKIPA